MKNLDFNPLVALSVEQFKNLLEEALSASKLQSQKEAFPEIYGIETFCKVTGYKKSTAYQKVHRKGLQFFKRGTRVLFRHKDVMSWLLENRVKTVSEFCKEQDEKLINRKGRGNE